MAPCSKEVGLLDVLSWTASGLPLQAEGSWRGAHCQAVNWRDGLL